MKVAAMFGLKKQELFWFFFFNQCNDNLGIYLTFCEEKKNLSKSLSEQVFNSTYPFSQTPQNKLKKSFPNCFSFYLSTFSKPNMEHITSFVFPKSYKETIVVKLACGSCLMAVVEVQDIIYGFGKSRDSVEWLLKVETFTCVTLYIW